jgi:hypothetical protein
VSHKRGLLCSPVEGQAFGNRRGVSRVAQRKGYLGLTLPVLGRKTMAVGLLRLRRLRSLVGGERHGQSVANGFREPVGVGH